jgi:hypothetical protein
MLDAPAVFSRLQDGGFAHFTRGAGGGLCSPHPLCLHGNYILEFIFNISVRWAVRIEKNQFAWSGRAALKIYSYSCRQDRDD